MHILILGGSSGIGAALAGRYAGDSANRVCVIGRRADLLDKLSVQFPGVLTDVFDLTSSDLDLHLDAVIGKMDYVDLVIYCAGTGEVDSEYRWTLTAKTIELNVMAFAKTAGFFLHYFMMQGAGHFVAVSSVGGLCGFENDAAYSASKGFMNLYMEGLKRKVYREKLPLVLTTVLPGYVDTAMLKVPEGCPRPSPFWVTDADAVAVQMISAIRKKRKTVYIPYRWRWVGVLLSILPEWVFLRF